MPANPIAWFEIDVQDLDRARRFYETVLQTTLDALPAPEGEAAAYQMLAFPSSMNGYGAAGSLVKADGVASGGGATLVYFACADCAVELGRVVAAGGRVVKPKFSIGPHGHCAIVVDTEGNAIGLHSMQ